MSDPAADTEATRPLPPIETDPAPAPPTLDSLWARLHYQEARLGKIEERLAWVETHVGVRARSGPPPLTEGDTSC